MSNSVENLVKDISVLTVVQLAELTKALEEKFGVSAAMSMSAAPAAASSAGAATESKEEEKSEYKVELIDSGAEKIKTIKALRKVKKDLGLTEAKAMVDSTPAVIAEGVSKADAKMIQDEMEAAGAKVRLS